MNDPRTPEELPLLRRRILITRAPHQASELADRLSELGATPILIPTIEIGPPSSFSALDLALESLATFDLIAFTSSNAVRAFHERAVGMGITPAPRRIAVVGSTTARAVEEFAMRVDVMPPIFTAESLGQTLLPEVQGKKILLVLAEYAPGNLASALKEGGGEVTVAAAYNNRIPETSLSAVSDLFAEPRMYPDAVTFTSASTAKNLATLLEAAGLNLPESVTRASIGPITSRAMVELGMAPHVEAAQATIPALVEAVVAELRKPAEDGKAGAADRGRAPGS